MDGIETLPYDENLLNVGIECQTCGTMMSLHRGRFPICDDCLKVKLYFDGEKWVNLDIGKIDPLYGILMS